MAKPTNADVASVLERIADLLEAQDSNPFRVRAYREGAQTLRNLDRSVADLVNGDRFDDITALPNIGSGIAAVIGEYVLSGQPNLLQELESKASPEDVFVNVPGIGRELARRVVDQLDITTLAELEEAAHDGRLSKVEGFGGKRVEGVRNELAGMLSRSARTRQQKRTADTGSRSETSERPSVELLLKVDAEYRQRAEAGDLPKIAPRRFNPENEAWLPVLNTEAQGWKFTALFSNTAQAHRLEKTRDWVVIYFKRDNQEDQHTVVTETKGGLKGKRVVRGRDTENRRYYR